MSKFGKRGDAAARKHWQRTQKSKREGEQMKKKTVHKKDNKQAKPPLTWGEIGQAMKISGKGYRDLQLSAQSSGKKIDEIAAEILNNK